MSESNFGQQIRSAATPSDRKSGVDRRARRRRPLVVLAAAAVTGLTLVAVAALARPELGAGEPSQTVGDAASPSASATDGVLRTAGCATFPLAGPTEIDGTPVSPNSELLNELSERIQPDASTNFADVFAGVEFTDIGRLRVYRTPSSAFDAWIVSDFAQDCVEVADAKASAAEMEAWSTMFGNDLDYWRSRGIQVLIWGGNPVTGVIEIGVRAEDLARAREEIPRYYPNLQIVISPSEGVSWSRRTTPR